MCKRNWAAGFLVSVSGPWVTAMNLIPLSSKARMLFRQSTRDRPKRSNFQTRKESNFLARASAMSRFCALRQDFAPLITSW